MIYEYTQIFYVTLSIFTSIHPFTIHHHLGGFECINSQQPSSITIILQLITPLPYTTWQPPKKKEEKNQTGTRDETEPAQGAVQRGEPSILQLSFSSTCY